MSDIDLFSQAEQSPFDAIKQVREDGSEFWSARALMPMLGYGADWRNFVAAIERARATAENQGMDPSEVFVGVTENSSERGGRPRQDFEVARFGAYLIAMNGDPRKPKVADAQAYFAIRTREAEVARPKSKAELLLESFQMLAADVEAERARADLAEAQLVEASKKATAWDEFLAATGDVSVNEAAKAVSRKAGRIIGERRLRAKFEQWSWIYRDHAGHPRAYQSQMDNGRLAERSRFHYHPETGEKVMDPPQVRVTAKGLDAIRTRLNAEAAGDEVAS